MGPQTLFSLHPRSLLIEIPPVSPSLPSTAFLSVPDCESVPALGFLLLLLPLPGICNSLHHCLFFFFLSNITAASVKPSPIRPSAIALPTLNPSLGTHPATSSLKNHYLNKSVYLFIYLLPNFPFFMITIAPFIFSR